MGNTTMDTSPLCITVGITGHRDIPDEDIAILRAVIEVGLLELQANFKDTPLLILSGLAEGADRLVVEVAYEMGIAFAAILPLPKNDYAKDFTEPSSKQAFYTWLDRAVWIETLTQNSSEGLISYQRDQCYEQLGFYLAKNSQLLIALWDGDIQEKTGGTSQVVRYCLEGLTHAKQHKSATFELPGYRPVIHILTRRLSQFHAISLQDLGKQKWLWPVVSAGDEEWLQHRWRKTLNHIGLYNLDMREFVVNNHASIQSSLTYLLGDLACFDELDTKARRIASDFAVSDAMSSHAQVLRRRNFLCLVFLALIAVISQQCYGYFLKWHLLVGSLGLAMFSYLLYHRAQKQRLEIKYLDYRALAEGLRVQFFWYVSGISESVSDYFLKDQRDELEWIRQAIFTTELPNSNTNFRKPTKWLLQRWIRDQRIYFIGDQQSGRKGKARIDATKEAQLIHWMRISFFAGLILMLSTAVAYELYFETLPLDWKGLLLNGFLASSGAMLCVVPAIKLYLDTMAYDEHAKRYLRMGQYYAQCEKQLKTLSESDSAEAVEKLLFNIGKQALIENGDWLLLHRQRPVKVPVM